MVYALAHFLSFLLQYKDSAYIHIGGLPYQLTEGDVITICSQSVTTLPSPSHPSLPAPPPVADPLSRLCRYGEVVDVSLPRDANTQKPKGFAFVMYADQRSTVLAVDNLGGAKVLDRTLKVDHVLNYKQLERDNDTGKMKERETQRYVWEQHLFRSGWWLGLRVASRGADLSSCCSRAGWPPTRTGFARPSPPLRQARRPTLTRRTVTLTRTTPCATS